MERCDVPLEGHQRLKAWENIIIVDFVSTLTEITMTFNEADSERAFRTLKNLINENRKS